MAQLRGRFAVAVTLLRQTAKSDGFLGETENASSILHHFRLWPGFFGNLGTSMISKSQEETEVSLHLEE